MLTRRQLLGAAALLPAACAWPRATGRAGGAWVNDVHSRLNRTQVRRIERPGSIGELQQIVRAGEPISIAGGRHAMGGQQFAADTVLLDTTGLDRIYDFDSERGHIEVGAGIQWPALIEHLVRADSGWGIVQKQTGADRLCIGGALAANVHGRGLAYAPIAQDVEAFTLVDARGELRRCSRSENPELFALAIGGYGLFGPIAAVRLRLARRRKVQRVVEIVDTADVARRFEERVRDGFLFGDCQYSTDLGGETLLRRGVFSCYRPVPDDTPIPARQGELSEADWLDLTQLGHTDRARAFDRYGGYYVSTSGQVYWSDTHQLSTYIDDYHGALAARLGAQARGTEMISEIYVPRDALYSFLEQVRGDFLAHDVNLIYGTIRLIERDTDTFLPWAKDRWACVIFNLHTQHDAAALRKTQADFRRLIDRGLAHGGSYFLTYHSWASRQQVLAAYPELPGFLDRKREYDPQGRFQSEWYRHYATMFAS
jgi:FAD/FMN-containing dehydrogenase